MTVSCIRIGAVRLCLALILGLLVISGYVVAPVLFDRAPSIAMAGMLAGEIFHVANIGILFLAAAVSFFWLRIAKGGSEIGKYRWLLLTAIAGLVVIAEFAVAPVLVDLKLQMGAIDDVAADHPLRQEFGLWHGISAMFHLITALCAALLVAIGATAQSRPKVSGEACQS